jgi:pimeloyl-ACP methyl ester carboxylesterase
VGTPDRFIVLPDGRRLGYAEYGDPQGRPLLYFPGTPHSRLSAPNDESWLVQGGIRFITLERPGFGISEFQPGRRLLDWPVDVGHFLDRLGIARCYVAGTSGGAPYVAACGHAMPDRLRRAAIVAGGGPLDAPQATSGMAWSRRSAVWLLRCAPSACERLGGALPFHRHPGLIYRYMRRALATDAEVLASRWPVLMADVSEALRPGMRGFVRELRIFAGDWGFRLEDISVPVDVWHGEADRATPIAMGRHMARCIPGARPHWIPGAGHLLWYSHQEEIIRGLLE